MAVYGVVPVAAIVPVFTAATYHYSTIKEPVLYYIAYMYMYVHFLRCSPNTRYQIYYCDANASNIQDPIRASKVRRAIHEFWPVSRGSARGSIATKRAGLVAGHVIPAREKSVFHRSRPGPARQNEVSRALAQPGPASEIIKISHQAWPGPSNFPTRPGPVPKIFSTLGPTRGPRAGPRRRLLNSAVPH